MQILPNTWKAPYWPDNVTSTNSRSTTSPGDEGHRCPSPVRKVSSVLVPPRVPQLTTPWPAPAPDRGYQALLSLHAAWLPRQVWRCGGRGNGNAPNSRPGCPTGPGEGSRGGKTPKKVRACHCTSARTRPFSPSQCPAQLCPVTDRCWGPCGTLEPQEGGGGRRRATAQSSAPHSRGASEAAGTGLPPQLPHTFRQLPASRCSLPAEPSMPGAGRVPGGYGPSCPSELSRQGAPTEQLAGHLPALAAPPPPFCGLAGSWIGGGGEIETTPPQGYIHNIQRREV